MVFSYYGDSLNYMKGLIRAFLWFLHLDITRNLKYDRLTWRVMKKVLNKSSNCIDIGCHKGELLEWMIKLSPHGKHYAFEPIPELNTFLNDKFGKLVTVSSIALSDEDGEDSFRIVKNAPAYSGFKERTYSVSRPEIQTIKVQKSKLDTLIPVEYKPNLIKIDVEGAEYQVLCGAITTLIKHKPYVLFEFGLGAADHYSTSPDQVFSLFDSCNLQVSTLSGFLNNSPRLSLASFQEHFNTNSEYYFIAHPVNEAY